jgi:Tol biopolymer transport system component
MVSIDSEVQLLFDKPHAELSPDGTKVLYVEENEVWLSDLTTGDTRNLTQTPADWKCCPQWWPARPDTIILQVRPEGSPLMVHGLGYIAALDLNSNGYQVLDDALELSANITLSPDGQSIAYHNDGPRFYHWGIGIENIDTTSWQIEPPQERPYLSSATWSPDGSSVAWMASLGLVETEYGQLVRWGILIFDSETNVAHIVHTFLAGGTDVAPSPPSWNTDGQWVAIRESISQHSDGSFWTGLELWLVAADGSGEKIGLDIGVEHFIRYWSVAWSPDGRWLAFAPEPNEEPAVWLAEVGTWQVYRIPLPGNEGVTVRDWLAVSP